MNRAVRTGPGKTRAARDLVAGLRSDGWVAGLVRETVPSAASAGMAKIRRPVLLVIDDAERRVDQVAAIAKTLLDQLAERSMPARLLLTRPDALPRDMTGLRVVDLKLPQEFGSAYPGPQFGLPGSRRLTGVHDRPIIGTIIKPSVGLTAGETAQLVHLLADAGDALVVRDPSCRMSTAVPWLKLKFVEKPPAMKGAEMDELVRLASERELVLMPGHLLLYHPGVRKLKELGLTESLNPGYRLSPRGKAVLDALDR